VVSPLFWFLLTPAMLPNFKWNPFSGGHIYTGVGKLAIFDGYRRLSRKRYEIGRWLLWNVNRKSWCRIEWYNFQWPWVNPNPGFKVTVYLWVEYLKNGALLGIKLLKNTNRKPYTIYRMVPLSSTLSDLWPGFQGDDIFRHWISDLRNDTR